MAVSDIVNVGEQALYRLRVSEPGVYTLRGYVTYLGRDGELRAYELLSLDGGAAARQGQVPLVAGLNTAPPVTFSSDQPVCR